MKIFTQFILSLIGSMLLGTTGLLLGATIGGNFGFPELGGNVGYESGGVFFAIVGISIGSLLGIMIAKKLQKETQKQITISIISIIIMITVGVIIFDYNMPLVIGLTILFMPPIVLTLITNLQKFFKQ